MKAKSSNVYPCRTCDSKFTTRQSKYRHEETRKVRLMSGSYCGKTTHRKHNLKIHFQKCIQI